jgi:hypothetical protein
VLSKSQAWVTWGLSATNLENTQVQYTGAKKSSLIKIRINDGFQTDVFKPKSSTFTIYFLIFSSGTESLFQPKQLIEYLLLKDETIFFTRGS